MKNLATNCLGGLAFWAFGWGLSMGRSSYSTAFFGRDCEWTKAFLQNKLDRVIRIQVQALGSSSTSQTGWTWRTRRERWPSSTTSRFVLSTPPLSPGQWLRGVLSSSLLTAITYSAGWTSRHSWCTPCSTWSSTPSQHPGSSVKTAGWSSLEELITAVG